MPKQEKHEHELQYVGAIVTPETCIKCGDRLIASEIEIIGTFYEVGGYCENQKCDRFLVLVV
jgi:hypothetical protein